MEEVRKIVLESCQIYLGPDLDFFIDEFIGSLEIKPTKIFILIDENIQKYCLNKLTGVEIFNKAELLEIRSGEENKTLENCRKLWFQLAEKEADRNSILINLGGGMICDIGGFVASTFKRGMRFINIPTTLLAQVDAAIGGKVGVDFEHLKNQIGVFSNPEAIFINPVFLQTLAKDQLFSGYFEIIKHALIADYSYWEYLKKSPFEKIVNFNSNNQEWYDIIFPSINIKTTIILEDPKERGIRKKLNFGHTIGHAIETYSLRKDGNPLMHGEAVAIGMICEAFLSYRYTGLSQQELREIVDHIQKNYRYYPIELSAFDTLLDLMLHDKKRNGKGLNFTLLSSIGKSVIDKICSRDIVIMALDFYRNL